jgi:hypothetical protein
MEFLVVDIGATIAALLVYLTTELWQDARHEAHRAKPSASHGLRQRSSDGI